MYSNDDLRHYIQGIAATCLKVAKQLDEMTDGDLAYFLEAESWNFPIEIEKDKIYRRPLIIYPISFDERFRNHVNEGLTVKQQQIAYLCRDGFRLSQEFDFEKNSIVERIAFGICLEEIRAGLEGFLSEFLNLSEINESIIRRHILSSPNIVDIDLARSLIDPKEFGDIQKIYFKKLVFDPRGNMMTSESAMKNLISSIRSEIDKSRRKKKT